MKKIRIVMRMSVKAFLIYSELMKPFPLRVQEEGEGLRWGVGMG